MSLFRRVVAWAGDEASRRLLDDFGLMFVEEDKFVTLRASFGTCIATGGQ